MAESTLAMQKSDLQDEVAHFVGYGSDSTTWNTHQSARITAALKSGLRQFYFTPAIEGHEAGYDWSFLRPTVEITLASGARTLELPDDFGGFEGRLTIQSTSSESFHPFDLVSVNCVDEAYSASPDQTGRPLMACLEPIKGTTAIRGQRQQIRVFPEADQAYPLKFQYYLIDGALTDDRPYPYGGAAHAETILAACLAAAEWLQEGVAGVMGMKFRERLAASINHDRKYKPQTFGIMRDGSDSMEYPRRSQLRWQTAITFDGVTPSS